MSQGFKKMQSNPALNAHKIICKEAHELIGFFIFLFFIFLFFFPLRF